MNIDLAVQVVAWAMTVTPVTVFLVISFYMMWGASQDDDSIKGLILLGIGIFSIGLVLLVLSYFTGFSVSWFFGTPGS